MLRMLALNGCRLAALLWCMAPALARCQEVERVPVDGPVAPMIIPLSAEEPSPLKPALEPPQLTPPQTAGGAKSGDAKPGTDASKSMDLKVIEIEPPAKSAAPGNGPAGQGRNDSLPAKRQEGLGAPTRAKPAEGSSSPAKPGAVAAPRVIPPKRIELTEELTGLRDHLRGALAQYAQQTFNTREFTAHDLLSACLPFGCESEIAQGNQRINGITCLCWNFPCAGYELLMVSDSHVAARVGIGRQNEPGELLSVLALARVPPTYPVRAADLVRSVGDLVESEKLECQEGQDQSLRLIGLSYYLPFSASWKNRSGRPWSLERLIDSELDRPQALCPCGGTHRLLALSCALANPGAKPANSATVLRAEKFLREYQAYAFKLQNADGSWHPAFFAATGSTNDQLGQLRSTGHVAQWLAVSLSEEQLIDPRMVRAMGYLAAALGSQQARFDGTAMTSRQVEGLMHALHAVTVYDQRLFVPLDPPPEQEPKSPPPQTAAADQ